MKEEKIKELNIYERMSFITDEIGVVIKGLKVQINQKSSYNAVSERDILDNVKPIEKKYRVYSYPVERNIVDSGILTKNTDYGESKSLYMRLEITYRFINMDNPSEYVDIKTYGDGIDTGDKAPGKAMTYGDKYALMKAYKISTGDDPDKEASPEQGYVKTESKATPKQVEILEKVYVGETREKLLKANNVEKLEDLSVKKASELIKKLKERSAENGNS